MISDSIQVACADVCRRSPLLTVSTLLAATATRYAPLAGLPLMGTSALLIGLDSGVDSATSNLALVSTLLASWLSLGLWACAWRTRRSTRRCVRRHVGFRSQSGSLPRKVDDKYMRQTYALAFVARRKTNRAVQIGRHSALPARGLYPRVKNYIRPIIET